LHLRVSSLLLFVDLLHDRERIDVDDSTFDLLVELQDFFSCI
jgi:hypothetical protein